MLSKEEEKAEERKKEWIRLHVNDPEVQQDIERLNKDPFLARIREIADSDSMEAQFNLQIQDLIDLPIQIKSAYGLETAWLVQQGKSITDLAHQFQREFEQFKVPQAGQQQSTYDLFNTIMSGEKYDTEICYTGEYRLFTHDPEFDWVVTLPLEACGLHEYDAEKPIQKLKNFFDSSHYSPEEKKQIEVFIIFALILQATWDLYAVLKWYPLTGLSQDPKYHADNYSSKPITKWSAVTLDHVRNYLSLLDNMTYKYSPTAYKLFSSLVELSFWLVVSAVFSLPGLIPFLLGGGVGYLAIALILGLTCLFIPFAIQMHNFHCDPDLNARWGTNWAYRLPARAVENGSAYVPGISDSPADIGILPVSWIFGHKKFGPAGASFKLMSQFGFFPLKETTIAAVEMAEEVLLNATGKNTVHYPSSTIFAR